MGAGRKILVVDDSPVVRALARDLFQDLGCDVLEAYNARQALALVDRQGPDFALALIDVCMPGAMDGIALARRLHEIHPGLTIALTSGDFAGPPAGLDVKFLPKPWTPKQFADLVRLMEAAPKPN